MDSITKKRNSEKQLVEQMILLYCKGNKHSSFQPCEECKNLNIYAHTKLDKCPFMEKKTFCSACEIHCYSPDMQEKIRKVMRYSGPRIILRHPVMVLRHFLQSIFSEQKE